MTDLPERLVRERDLIVAVVGERWKRALLASVGKWLLDFARAARRAGGGRRASARCRSCCSPTSPRSCSAQIPITPGGLGFVEAGLTGTLALVGVSGGDAVLATLAYRLFSYWLPIPFGGRDVVAVPPPPPGEPPLTRGTDAERAPQRRVLERRVNARRRWPSSATPGTDGTPRTRMPAARALAAPVGESSSAMQAAGPTPSAAAAAR